MHSQQTACTLGRTEAHSAVQVPQVLQLLPLPARGSSIIQCSASAAVAGALIIALAFECCSAFRGFERLEAAALPAWVCFLLQHWLHVRACVLQY